MIDITKKVRKKRFALRRAKMVEEGITETAIAKKLGVTQHAISMVLSEASKSVRIQKAIAKKLNIPYKKFWGDRA